MEGALGGRGSVAPQEFSAPRGEMDTRRLLRWLNWVSAEQTLFAMAHLEGLERKLLWVFSIHSGEEAMPSRLYAETR